MNRHYLALDLGAESGRAIIARVARGRIELQELHRFPNIPVQLPTGLYWDTLRLFHELCEGIRCGAKAVDEIDGIAVDTWGVDFGLVGGDGELLHPPRHYRDHRNVGTFKQVFELVPRDEIFRETGVQFMEINSLYQLWVMRRDSPEILDQVAKLLFMPDLFNYFLTGTYAAERTIASTSQFYNPVKKGFATDMLRKLDIAGSFFPELVDPGAELGPVLPYAANRCGLKRDTLVYTTGSHDTASAVAAVPAVGNGWCYISSGTWSLMGVETQEAIIDDASLDANFTNEIGVGGTVRLLKNIPGLWVLQECRRAWAKEGAEYAYGELAELAKAAKPIDTILDLDQFVLPGDHPERIRQFCVITGQEIPADVGGTVRVILQSLAERYRQVLELLERLTKKSIETIHIVGGGSQNAFLNQMVADRTGRRVVAGPAEATALGNSLTQAMGTGQIRSLEEMRAVVRASFELHEFTPKA
ncbi:MAG: rhamnulokinase family protein [Bryobacteraceae bacterium]